MDVQAGFNRLSPTDQIAMLSTADTAVGRCRLAVSKLVLKAQRVWFHRLRLECDEPISNFAFKFNLRRYTAACLTVLENTPDDRGRPVQVHSVRTRVERVYGLST
jgi:hypothetical protein